MRYAGLRGDGCCQAIELFPSEQERIFGKPGRTVIECRIEQGHLGRGDVSHHEGVESTEIRPGKQVRAHEDNGSKPRSRCTRSSSSEDGPNCTW